MFVFMFNIFYTKNFLFFSKKFLYICSGYSNIECLQSISKIKLQI